MTTDFQALFREIFTKNGLECFCDAKTVSTFEQFTDLLQEENAHTNLTAIRDVSGIISKHYADCLLAASLFPQNATVLDLGCGGGFPTIPLAIARPDLQITAIDSTAKKIRFVEKAADVLSLSNVKPLCSRAEDPSLKPLRETFDVVTSRAMARMNVLCELCLPYVKIGGFLLAMKASKAEEETTEALNCIKTLGGGEPELFHCGLAHLDEVVDPRCLIKIEKKAAHPKGYPRAYAQIAKKPL